jgi:hypothetical protein
MIARDDLKRMNVDQLDDAFRLDIVDASTLVWKQGMDKWRRLGSIAGIEEDEPETIARVPARPFGPPAAPPPPRPRPLHQQSSVAPGVNPFAATVQPYASVNPFGATAPYASNAPAAVFQAPRPAPAPQLFAPDPYAMPKRRVKLDSADLNFHGKSIHWGRWLFGFVLLTAGVLAAYRQNYLREGARKIGLENKYLYGEKRAIGWVTAKAPGAVQAALRQLELLPGPNAVAALTPAVAAAAPAAPAPAPAPEPIKASAPATPPAADPGLKTVSLDSLPVLGAEPEAKPEPVAPKTRAAAPSAPSPKVASRPAKRAVAQDDEPAPKPAKAKAEPAPKPKAAKAPPSNMSSPLKAAIWQAMQEDAKKGK